MAAGCGGQDIKDPYGINLRSAPRPWCGARAAGPQWRSRQSPPPVRSSEIRALTTKGLLSPIRRTPGRSTQLITAVPGSWPATGGKHPQHGCGRLRECLCSTGPGSAAQQGRGIQRPERGSQTPHPPPYRWACFSLTCGSAVRASQRTEPCLQHADSVYN